MLFSESDKAYLDKLRRNNPGMDIPENNIVEIALSKMKSDGGEKVIDDLIIRTYQNMVEFELI